MTHANLTRITTTIFASAAAAALTACGGATEAESDTATEASADVSADTGVDLASLDTSDAGPATGATVPADMALLDMNGAPTSIGAMAGENGTVLVFSRSVAWCPFCQAQIKGLKDVAEQIGAKGYGLAAITYDDPAVLKTFATDQDIGFGMISDTGSKLIDAMEIRDPQYTEGMAVGVPYASIFVIDANGVVKARAVSSDYKVRPANADVLAMIDSIG